MAPPFMVIMNLSKFFWVWKCGRATQASQEGPRRNHSLVRHDHQNQSLWLQIHHRWCQGPDRSPRTVLTEFTPRRILRRSGSYQAVRRRLRWLQWNLVTTLMKQWFWRNLMTCVRFGWRWVSWSIRSYTKFGPTVLLHEQSLDRIIILIKNKCDRVWDVKKDWTKCPEGSSGDYATVSLAENMRFLFLT